MRVYRPDPEPPPEPDIQVASLWGEESWRAVDIALAGHEPGSRLVFGGGESGWEPWCLEVFGPRFVPLIIRAREAGERGVREWGLVDQRFAEVLPGPGALARSLRVGRGLAAGRAGARHLQPLDRLRRKLDEEPGTGHAAMVVAFLGAQFNVPTTACVVACLFLEWRSSFPEKERGEFERMTPRLGSWLSQWFRSASFPALQSDVPG